MISRRHLLALVAVLPLTAAGAAPVRVRMVTELGPIVIELYPDKAPITVANFLAYADKHLLDGGAFYRTVSPKNDNNPATISVIQGGLNRDDSPLPAIAHETTKVTGVLHADGVISMARGAPGTAGRSSSSASATIRPWIRRGAQQGRPGLRGVRQGGRGHGCGPKDPRRPHRHQGRRSLSERADHRKSGEDSKAKPELRQLDAGNRMNPEPFSCSCAIGALSKENAMGDNKTRNPQQQQNDPQRQAPGQQHQQGDRDRQNEQGRNPGGQANPDQQRRDR
jgi:hypothetical protein